MTGLPRLGVIRRGDVGAGPHVAGGTLVRSALLLVALAYALTFDRLGIREDDLQKLELTGRVDEENP